MNLAKEGNLPPTRGEDYGEKSMSSEQFDCFQQKLIRGKKFYFISQVLSFSGKVLKQKKWLLGRKVFGNVDVGLWDV